MQCSTSQLVILTSLLLCRASSLVYLMCSSRIDTSCSVRLYCGITVAPVEVAKLVLVQDHFDLLSS